MPDVAVHDADVLVRAATLDGNAAAIWKSDCAVAAGGHTYLVESNFSAVTHPPRILVAAAGALHIPRLHRRMVADLLCSDHRAVAQAALIRFTEHGVEGLQEPRHGVLARYIPRHDQPHALDRIRRS